MEEKIQFEVVVTTMDTGSSEGMFTQVSDYHLTHDKIWRKIVPSQGYTYAGIDSYALNMAEVLQT